MARAWLRAWRRVSALPLTVTTPAGWVSTDKYDALGRHSRLGKNLRVHDDDVGHRHKRRKTTQHLLLNGSLIFGEFEITIDQSSASNHRFSELMFLFDHAANCSTEKTRTGNS